MQHREPSPTEAANEVVREAALYTAAQERRLRLEEKTGRAFLLMVALFLLVMAILFAAAHRGSPRPAPSTRATLAALTTLTVTIGS